MILRDWLPAVLHSLEPWVSSEDITKGGRWSDEIAAQLGACTFGIICVTPDNAASPWLNFEAGALSRTLPDARVAPFLVGMNPSELAGPLAQFQVTTVRKAEVRKLLESINESMHPDGIAIDRLRKTFDLCWHDLEASLGKLQLPTTKTEASIVPKSVSNDTRHQELQPIEERILVAIAEGVVWSDGAYTPLSWVCSHAEVTATRAKYHIEQMAKSDLVRIDPDDDCYLKAPGRAYLIEHDLIE